MYLLLSGSTEVKLTFLERVKQRSSVKESWVITVGLAVRWHYTGMQMGGQFLQLSTISLPQLPSYQIRTVSPKICQLLAAQEISSPPDKGPESCSSQAGQKFSPGKPAGTRGEVGTTIQSHLIPWEVIV